MSFASESDVCKQSLTLAKRIATTVAIKHIDYMSLSDNEVTYSCKFYCQTMTNSSIAIADRYAISAVIHSTFCREYQSPHERANSSQKESLILALA